ncbi:MAG: EAL domain-containing protein [Alphaproteobacteria bacterium]|nr:EAL domain-containing protein [Alphaproteobacteria bacterium]
MAPSAATAAALRTDAAASPPGTAMHAAPAAHLAAPRESAGTPRPAPAPGRSIARSGAALIERICEAARRPGRHVAIVLPLARQPLARRRPYHLRVAKVLLQDLAMLCQGQVFPLGGGTLALLGREPPETERARLAATLDRLFHPRAPEAPAARLALPAPEPGPDTNATGPEADATAPATPPPASATEAAPIRTPPPPTALPGAGASPGSQAAAAEAAPLMLSWALPERLAEAITFIADIAIDEAPCEPPASPELPVAPALLRAVLHLLAAEPVERLAQRQAAMLFLPGHGHRVLFHEVTVSLQLLALRLPGLARLHEDPYLLRHLGTRLDSHMLALSRALAGRAALMPGAWQAEAPGIAINLALSTVLSPAFTAFDAALAIDGRPRLWVEIAAQEAFADLAAFAEACRRLRALGHGVTLDGVSPTMFALTDPEALGCDLVKLDAPENPHAPAAEALAAALRRADPERILLMRCETRGQLAWGVGLGIMRAQGLHIDAILAEERLRLCHAARRSGCSAAQCAARAAALHPEGRTGCGNLPALDANPFEAA